MRGNYASLHLLQDLRERLVVGGDDGAVVVLQVLVDHGAAAPHAQPRHPLPRSLRHGGRRRVVRVGAVERLQHNSG